MRVAISGASGLIGSALASDLATDGVQVMRLVRRPARSADEISWDPAAVAGGLDPASLGGVDAVVHLAGAPIAPKRWTPQRKSLLRSSRITSMQNLARAIIGADPRPGVLLCGSAIGFYGDTGDRAVDETAPRGVGFLADLVRDWEAATGPVREASTRVVNLRSGVVLAQGGGMLGPLLPLFRLGLGGRIGSGSQYLSWISIADEVRAIRFLLDDSQMQGPVNLTSPQPVTNAEFTSALGRALGRPAVLAVPATVVRAALGEVSRELLGSVRALPARLTQAGFSFREPDITSALRRALAMGAAPG